MPDNIPSISCMNATLGDVVDRVFERIAPSFSTSQAYAIGDIVIYNKKIYVFNAVHAAGAWTGTDVDLKTVSQLTLGGGGGSSSTIYTTTLLSTGWSSSAPYSQTLTIQGLTVDDYPIMDLVPDDNASTAATQITQYDYITKAITGANSLTVYCNTNCPSVNLPLILKT